MLIFFFQKERRCTIISQSFYDFINTQYFIRFAQFERVGVVGGYLVGRVNLQLMRMNRLLAKFILQLSQAWFTVAADPNTSIFMKHWFLPKWQVRVGPNSFTLLTLKFCDLEKIGRWQFLEFPLEGFHLWIFVRYIGNVLNTQASAREILPMRILEICVYRRQRCFVCIDLLTIQKWRELFRRIFGTNATSMNVRLIFCNV